MNFKKVLWVTTALSFLVASMSGCASVGSIKHVKDSISKSHSVVQESMSSFKSSIHENKFVTERDGVWVSAKTVTADMSSRFNNSWLDRDFIWENFVLVSFYDIIGGVEKAFPDLLITYNDDVPDFFKRIASAAKDSNSSASSTKTITGSEVYIRYSGDLNGFLDNLAAKKGLSWKVVGDKHIEFSYQQTKVFHLNIMAGKLNSSGKVSLGSDSGSSNAMNAEFDLVANLWDEVSQTVGTYLSQGGIMSASPSTGAIMVKDNERSLSRIEDYINSINKDMSRQIVVDVKVYKVTKNVSDGYGLDWNAIYTSVRGKFSIAGGTAFTGGLPTQGLSSLTTTILSPNSPYKGTTSIVKALSTQGGLSIVTETQVVTMNNMPVPIAQSNEISFIESQSAATVDVAGNTIPGAITPGTKTVGFYMVLSPRILENNKLMLQMSIDLSDLTALVTRSASKDPNASVIQTPEIARNSFFQRVILNSGETLMMTGFSKSKSSYTDAGIGKASNFSLGGSRQAKQDNEYLVMLVTPTITEMSIR